MNIRFLKKQFLNLQTVVRKYHNIESAKIWPVFELWAILLHSFQYFSQAKKVWWCTKIDKYYVCPRVCWALGNSFSGLIAFCAIMMFARNVSLNKKRDTVKIAKIKAKCSNLSSSCFIDDLKYLLYRLSCFQMMILITNMFTNSGRCDLNSEYSYPLQVLLQPILPCLIVESL